MSQTTQCNSFGSPPSPAPSSAQLSRRGTRLSRRREETAQGLELGRLSLGSQSSPSPSDSRFSQHAQDTDAATHAPSQPTVKPQKSTAFYMSFLALNLMAFITSWDSTSLAVALPTITKDVGGTALESFWASISFFLGVAVTQPIYVSTSDVLGRKIPLYASMILFAAGAIVFALAQSIGVVIVGRVLQGLGAGGLDVLEEIILADITSLKERPKYLGLLAVSIAIGSMAGPVFGALFSQYVTWRWIGWLNLPIIGTAFVLAVFFLKIRSIDMSFGAKVRRLDGIGMTLFALGATATALPLSWAGSLYEWSSWRTIVPLIIGVLVLVGFGVYERRPAEAVIPYRIFNNMTSVASLVGSLIHGAILYTMLNYLPLFFQAVWLETPIGAAVSILPVSSTVVAFSIFAPVTIEITRKYRILLWIGWAIMIVFLALWVHVDQSTSRAVAYTFQALLGVGVGTIFTGVQIPMQAAVGNVDDTGLAVGMLVVFRLFGALLGLSIGSTVFNSVFQHSIKALGTLPDAVKVLQDPREAVEFIPTLRTLDLPHDFMVRLIEAYTKPFFTIWIVFACLAGLGLLSSFFIQELTLESEEVGRQAFEPVPQ